MAPTVRACVADDEGTTPSSANDVTSALARGGDRVKPSQRGGFNVFHGRQATTERWARHARPLPQ
jgi:hypothetical protein